MVSSFCAHVPCPIHPCSDCPYTEPTLRPTDNRIDHYGRRQGESILANINPPSPLTPPPPLPQAHLTKNLQLWVLCVYHIEPPPPPCTDTSNNRMINKCLLYFGSSLLLSLYIFSFPIPNKKKQRRLLRMCILKC
jgi:hypothetical protein